MLSISARSTPFYECSRKAVYPPKQTAYLLEGAGLPRPSGSRAIAADVHQPESAIGRLPRRALGQGRPDFQEGVR